MGRHRWRGNVRKTLRLKHGDMIRYRRYATTVIDAWRYYVFVSPMQKYVQTFLWDIGNRKMTEYKNAVKAANMTQGFREIYTSRTVEVGHHFLADRRKRADERMQRKVDLWIASANIQRYRGISNFNTICKTYDPSRYFRPH